MSNTAIAKRPVDRLKSVLAADTVREQFRNSMGRHADLFTASLIDLYGSDKTLQGCDPGAVVMEALKAATLKLPINKSLGYAWIIAYKEKGVPKPQFQIGYKGMIQLAVRSGQYKHINADIVTAGESIDHDRLTGELKISGTMDGKTVGYFAFFETVQGFRKAVYWTVDQVSAHAKRFSKSYGSSFSPWKSDFDEMAKKTMLRHLLSKYGIMSVEMIHANIAEEEAPQAIADREANQELIDIEPGPQAAVEAPTEATPISDAEAAEIQAQEMAEAGNGPDF